MRILVITPYYAPDLGPSAPLLTTLCEELVLHGHQVSVLAAVPHFPSGHVRPEYLAHAWSWETQNGVGVCRVWVPSGDRSNLRHRLTTFLIYQVLATFVGLRLSYDSVFVTNPALETILPFILLAWLRRKKSIFCVWDLYPEVGVQLGIFRHDWIIGVVKGMEDFCLHRSHAVQVLTASFVSSLQLRSIPSTKLHVIPPWVDTGFIHPLPRRNPFSKEHGLDDCFVVLYAGNLGLSQGLEHVLTAAELLSREQDIRFIFVGDGAARPRLATEASLRALTNVQFLPFQPRELLPQVLATADVSLVTSQKGIGSSSLPSKSFSILASGRPLLASVDEGSDLWTLIERAGAGICVPPESPSHLAKGILALKNDAVQRENMGQHGRAFALHYYSTQAAVSSFEALLAQPADCSEAEQEHSINDLG